MVNQDISASLTGSIKLNSKVPGIVVIVVGHQL
jgi:hypothetical protein